ERQLWFVGQNPDVAVAGSWICYINSKGRMIGRRKHPMTKRKQVRNLVEADKLIPLVHPSVMMRKSAFEAVGGYRPEFWPSDDLDLWPRFAEAGYGILVQNEFLTHYRLHDESICCAKVRETLKRVRWVRHCMRSRRRGEAECTWEQFVQIQRAL